MVGSATGIVEQQIDILGDALNLGAVAGGRTAAEAISLTHAFKCGSDLQDRRHETAVHTNVDESDQEKRRQGQDNGGPSSSARQTLRLFVGLAKSGTVDFSQLMKIGNDAGSNKRLATKCGIGVGLNGVQQGSLFVLGNVALGSFVLGEKRVARRIAGSESQGGGHALDSGQGLHILFRDDGDGGAHAGQQGYGSK